MVHRTLRLLVEVYPTVEHEFASWLNQNIQLSELSVGSRQKVWWKCPKGPDHVWEASPNQRTCAGKLHGCPICAGKLVVRSTSLARRRPDLLKEWDWERNKKMTSGSVSIGSNRVVWWRCPEGSEHVWRASVKSRTQKNNKCPVCQSLAFRYPKVLAEFHPTKNGDLNPFQLSFSSHRRVWWKCPKGPDHVWEASPNSRSSNQSGCPICSGHKVVRSNSLAITNPEIAAQWYYEKNIGLNPTDFYARSHLSVWWKCKEAPDHIWKSQIKSRTSLNLGCPFCSGRRNTKSNSLFAKKPKIAVLWHPTKNRPVEPTEVTPYSNRLVWWKCPEGDDHEWQATVANIVNGGSCPVCLGRRITATNNLFALYPHLQEEWDFIENSTINPWKLSPGSKQKVRWVCKLDQKHHWFAAIKDRTTRESGCPYCAERLNVSELRMLEIIKSLYPSEEINYRAKPKWLQRLELDIYIPVLNLAFEYQGQQHFKPIDLFGGVEAYIKQVERDRQKRVLCYQKGVILIEVNCDEPLSKEVILGKIEDAGLPPPNASNVET